MSKSFGTLFLDLSCAPLHQAGKCILGRQVVAGLDELASERLMAAVRRSVAALAKEAGLSVEEVEQLLPLAELQRVAGGVGQRQREAVEAWNMHAGHVGGLLEGVADLTQDGRPPDVSMCLERLADKVAADKAWARPLRDLAVDTHRWRELLVECRRLLDSGNTLETSRRRKRIRRLVVIVLIIALLVGSAAGAIWMLLRTRSARVRIDTVLTSSDVCATDKIGADDRSYASAEQKSTIAEHKRKCAEQKEQQQRAEEEQRAKDDKQQKEAAKKQEQEGSCATLVAAVRAGELTAKHKKVAGEAAALLDRVAAGKLLPADFGPPDPKLPCAGTQSRAELDEAFDQAVLRSMGAWLGADDVSPRVKKVLLAHQRGIAPRTRLLFGLHAETAAQRALVSGDQKGSERALRLCALKREMKIIRGSYCDALARSSK